MKEFNLLERVGVEEPRSYFIPFAESDAPKYEFGIISRNSSSEFIPLDGEWQIGSTSLSSEFEVGEKLTGTIPVPSCVQMHGFDKIQYINSRYPFPFDPPRVPKDTPCWHYRRIFGLDKRDGEKYYLNFEGVDSAFYLYVNGNYKGYSQISHSTSEFDITELVFDGVNVIDVFVLKWCASSYLECQDKFRFSGIFRSVYVLKRPERHLKDYKITAYPENGRGVLVFQNLGGADAVLNFAGKRAECREGETVTLRIDNATEWTAEHPVLYALEITAAGEVIYEQVGFVKSETVDGIFRINGKAVKLKGVNRHEFSPYTAATVSVKDTAEDLRLIKSLNCNAVRTSHYPDIPQFYQLCDVLGLYVLNEADVETHGAASVRGDYEERLWRGFADDMFWSEGIFDRHRTLVERDKNRPCVIMWSLGNESCFGKAFIKGAEYVKARGGRPVHYEGLQHAGEEYYYSGLVDTVSVMYPPYDWIEKQYLTDGRERRPLVICEYSHAMGNSCGDLADYWRIIYNEPRVAGAFVWEWCDHAIYTEKGWLYGGDFGEDEHDGNFCVDGLVTPDRRLKSAALEMKAVYGGKLCDKPYSPLKADLTPYGRRVGFSVDTDTAEISVLSGGLPLFESPLKLNVLRAYTDNDAKGAAKFLWTKCGLDKCRPAVLDYHSEGDCANLSGKMYVNSIEAPLEFSLSVKSCGNSLDVKLSYKAAEHITSLPRIGFEFAVDKKYSDFIYHGFGPNEAYCDKRLSSDYGEYYSNAEHNYFPYIMPQETGSHCDTTFLDIKGLVKITADKKFSFSVLPFSTRELLKKEHCTELERDGKVYVCIDCGMRGTGSNSCGPELKKEYEIAMSDEINFKLLF